MKAKGFKEVKKAAKLTIKKQKIESKIKDLSKQYANLINSKAITDEYFICLVEDFIKHSK